MDTYQDLRPLLAAEAAAEATAAATDPDDLEQAVWVRLLEQRPAGDRAAWVRRAVRTEARRARRRARREIPWATDPRSEPEGFHGPPAGPRRGAGPRDESPATGPESRALAAERDRRVRHAVALLPGRCPELLAALMAPGDPTYREIAGELGISQGSIGPVRSRCLACLRRMLAREIATPARWAGQA